MLNKLPTFLIYFPLSSLTVAQNEDVVKQFLEENSSAGKTLSAMS